MVTKSDLMENEVQLGNSPPETLEQKIDRLYCLVFLTLIVSLLWPIMCVFSTISVDSTNEIIQKEIKKHEDSQRILIQQQNELLQKIAKERNFIHPDNVKTLEKMMQEVKTENDSVVEKMRIWQALYNNSLQQQ